MANNKAVIYSEKDIIGIRKAARVTALVREQLRGAIKAGMSTKDIDNIAGELINATGGKSAFLGYGGFPGQICISVNDEVVHGIGRPGKIIQPGDIVSLDIGVSLDHYIGDNAETIAIGDVDKEVEFLLKKTRESLFAGINAAVKGNFVRDISMAVQKVAEEANLGIVREYVGHGCGINLHEPPEIPNYKTVDKGPRLQNGMVLAIEPMLNLGTHRVKTDKDGWTVRTTDARLSAHFEHMILINNDKPEILTWPKP